MPARILDCPDLRYKDGSARINQGAWNPQIFHNTKPIEYWFAISFGTRQPERNMRDLNGLVASLQQVCSFEIIFYQSSHCILLGFSSPMYQNIYENSSENHKEF